MLTEISLLYFSELLFMQQFRGSSVYFKDYIWGPEM